LDITSETLLTPAEAWNAKIYNGWKKAGLGTVEVIEKATGAKLGETGVASAADISAAAACFSWAFLSSCAKPTFEDNRSYQPHPFHAGMPVLADDDVIVHGNAERRGDVDDRLGHPDVCLRRRRIAGGVIVHQQDRGGR
jgi:hypothetical protein